MYFLNENMVQYVVELFVSSDTSTFEKRIAVGEKIFNTFGPGNYIDFTDRPFERFSDYENLLERLREADKDKYLDIHKGTPFFFLAWTAFELRNYEAGLFYIDCAIAEDSRNTISREWLDLSAARFLTFKDSDRSPAKNVINRCRMEWEIQIERFNSISGLMPFDLESLVDQFVYPLLERETTRTILTTLYTFVLEFTDRYRALRLRNSSGGSLEPLLQHLFKGGLLLESLLKEVYPPQDSDREKRRLLSDLLRDQRLKTDFEIQDKIDVTASTLQEIYDLPKDHSSKCAFEVTGKIRNTTGHNLTWDDVFSDPETYRDFFQLEMNAILYLIRRKRITGSSLRSEFKFSDGVVTLVSPTSTSTLR